MSPDAYAGFLKLLLTPTSREPSLSAEVQAYLEYANEQEPTPLLERCGLSDSPKRAA